MRRHARLAAASTLVVLMTGCSAGGVLSHDKLICRRFATGVSAVDSVGTNSTDLFASAVMRGRQEARRPGYLSADLAKRLRVMTSDACNIGRAVQGFTADCRAVGVSGPVWLEPYAPSCG
jgi:hypothetical protein